MAFTTFHRAINEVGRKDGEVWKTDSGWAGKRGGKTQYGLSDKDKAKAYVAGKDVETDDKKKSSCKEKPKRSTKKK